MNPLQLTLLGLLLATAATAQSPVRGTVTASGQPIPGAVVTVTQSGKSLTSTTDEDGRFTIDGIDAAAKTVEVRMFGFRPYRKEVAAGPASATIDVSLELAPAPVRTARATPRNGGAAAQSLTFTADENAALPPIPEPPSLESDSGESFLVNGSLSRGLGEAVPPDGPFAFGPGFGPGLGPGMGPGGFGGPGGAQGEEGGARPPGFGGGATAGAGGPGGGGPAGAGGRGGFGGPGGGGLGGGGGGGRGGGGGFGGPGARGGEMTPERRAAVERIMRERRGQLGGTRSPAVFGNRARRGREGMRGSVFFSLGNSALDAKPFSLTGQSLDKPSYAQSRFGLTLGGPLHIPKLLTSDKTFLFLNYTAARSRNPYTGFATMPSDLERGGDFSQSIIRGPVTIFDPSTGQPFAGNLIPATRINPIASGLLDFIPKPNAPGNVQNYRLVTSFPRNNDNLNLRVMQNLGGKLGRLSGSFNMQRRDGDSVALYGFRDATSGLGLNSDLSWNRTLASRTVVNLRLGFNRNRNDTVPFFAYGTDVAGELGIEGGSRAPVNYGPPNLNFTNFGDLNDGSPSLRRVNTWNGSGSVQFIRGSHTVTVGGELRRSQLNNLVDSNGRGSFTLTGLVTSALNSAGQPISGTGFDFADFLLGQPQNASVRYGGADTYFRSWTTSGYVQEDWRVSARLTLNLGLRYEYFAPFTEKYGRLVNLDIRGDFLAVAPVVAGATGPYSGEFPAGLVNPDRNNLAPRVAFAWRPRRGSRSMLVRGGYSMFYDSSIYNRLPFRLASQPPFATTATLNTSAARVLTFADGLVAAADNKQINNTFAVDRFYRTPYAGTWNLAVQREFPGALVIEAGYLGTKGTRLDTQRLPNRAIPGSPLDSEERRQIENAVGFTFDSSQANSIFHAGQVRVTRRMRRGVSMNAFYTFSKSIDNASSIGGAGSVVAQNDRDLDAERGLSTFDQRHALTLGGLLESPFGERGFWLKKNTALAHVFTGWTLTMNASARSGRPLTARVLGNASDAGGTGAVGSARADSTGLPIDAGAGFFNLLAFSVPLPGTFGNASRNTIPGPSQIALNAGFGRSFRLGDDRRRLDIRAEAQNVTNHVNFASLATTVNASNYGLATNAGSMRTISLQLRFRF